ncbi:hypothetical protein ACWDZ4_13860 [Streptomyces sp. NPDC003016]
MNTDAAWKAAATTVAPAIAQAVFDRLRSSAPGRPDGRPNPAARRVPGSGTAARR